MYGKERSEEMAKHPLVRNKEAKEKERQAHQTKPVDDEPQCDHGHDKEKKHAHPHKHSPGHGHGGPDHSHKHKHKKPKFLKKIEKEEKMQTIADSISINLSKMFERKNEEAAKK